MNFNEHRSAERLKTLTSEWGYLTPLQRYAIFLRFSVGILPRLGLNWLNNHVARRRAKFIPSVHWVGR